MTTAIKHIALLLFLIINSGEHSFAQCSVQWPDYNMQSDTIEDECKANFFDHGGPSGVYPGCLNNLCYDTLVIDNGPGSIITLTFTSFDTEIGPDSLWVYDGYSQNNILLLAHAGNTTPGPVTTTNGIGVMTIVWRYDNSGSHTGWAGCWKTQITPLIPPLMDANPVPSCNENFIIFDLTSNVPCDSIYGSDFEIRDYQNNLVPVSSAVPWPSCNNDSTNQVRVNLVNGIQENCEYMVDWELRLTDRCDSTWIFNVLDTFYVADCPFPVSITATDTTICPAQCTFLEAITPGCLTYLYNWSPNIGSGPGPHQVCPSVTTTYYLTVTDSTGNAPAAFDTFTVYVENPDITTGNTINLCQTDPPLQLTTSSSGGYWVGTGGVEHTNGLFYPNQDSASAGCHVIRYHFSPTCYDSIIICIDSIDAGFDEAACPDSAFQVDPIWGPINATWSDTGGYISPTGFFNTPSATGVYEVILTDPITLCTDTKLIYVDNIVAQTVPDTICESLPQYIPNIQPPGGILTGTGVTDTVLHIFDPQVSGAGTFNLTYSLHGCSDTWVIEVLPVDAGPNIVVCPGYHDTLTGTPNGGFWSTSFANVGNSVNTNTGEVIIANNSNDDNIRVHYHAPNGCIDTMWIYVRETKIGEDTLHFCESDPQLLLNYSSTGRTPANGIWTGPGLNNTSGTTYYFVPAWAGPGIHTLEYSKNGCSDTIKMIVYPDNLPLDDTVTCSAQLPFLIDSTLPPTGYWTGSSGIINPYTGLFDPSAALIDTFYIYWTSPAGCTDSVLIQNYQYFDAQINGLDSVYCYADSNFVFSFTPANDTVFGSGVSGNTFNPSVADTGWHMLTIDFGPTDLCYNADTFYVYVMPPLETSVTLNDDTICKGESTSMSVTGAGGDSTATFYTYAWSNNTANTSNVNNVGPDTTTTYYVTTSDGCSDPIIDTIEVAVAPPIDKSIFTSEKQCFGDTGFAFIDVIAPNDYTVTWNTNPVQSSDSIISTAGEFINFEITDNHFGCKFDSTVKIPSWLPVSAVFLVNPNEECIAYEFKDDLSIIDLSTNATTGIWEFSNGYTEPYILGINPEVPFDKAGTYSVKLRVENEGGCPDSTQIDICIDDKSSYFIPDAFSPNGDGLNDILYVRAKNIDKVKFVIYGRWGEKIFETEDLEQGWDGTFRGKPMNSGIFVYYVDIIFVDGTREVLKGDVSLVR